MAPVHVPFQAESPRIQPDPLAAFVRAHQAWVWRYLVFLGCERSLADDLTQDTFVAVLGREQSIGVRAQRSYMRRTAQSMLLKAHRRRRSVELVDELVAEAAFDLFCGADEGAGYLDALRQCLAQLDERQRQAIDWLYREGVSRGEVGRRLGLSEGGVKSLLRRVYARLRHCVTRRLA